MHPYLTRLGVRPEIQRYFAPFYFSGRNGDLFFGYGNDLEHFGFAFHKVPVTANCWLAGNTNLHEVRLVIIAASAMDCIAYLNIHFSDYTAIDNLLFVSLGTGINAEKINYLKTNFSKKYILLLLTDDVLSAITCLKIAAAIRRLPVTVSLSEKEVVTVQFRFSEYRFWAADFSLSAFERASNYRFRICVSKPRFGMSFLAQLQALAFPPI